MNFELGFSLEAESILTIITTKEYVNKNINLEITVG